MKTLSRAKEVKVERVKSKVNPRMLRSDLTQILQRDYKLCKQTRSPGNRIGKMLWDNRSLRTLWIHLSFYRSRINNRTTKRSLIFQISKLLITKQPMAKCKLRFRKIFRNQIRKLINKRCSSLQQGLLWWMIKRITRVRIIQQRMRRSLRQIGFYKIRTA